MITLMQFFRELKKEKTRILLTLFSIAWGTGSITFLLATGDGLMTSLRTSAEGLGKGMVVVWGGETTKVFKGLKTGRQIRLREEDVILLKERVPEISRISPEYSNWGMRVDYGENSVNSQMHGVWPDFGPLRNVHPQRGGRFINKSDVDLRRRVIFIGDEVETRLFENEEAVGKTIVINNVPFTVIGVMRSKVQSSSYSWMDKDKTFIPASTFRVMFGNRYLNNLVYGPGVLTRSEEIKRRVFEILGGKHKFDSQDDSALWMWDTVEEDEIFGKIFIGVQTFFGIIGLLTLIVAGVGLANIMYAMVKNRTREIGIKLAVGAKRRNIIGEYILQSIITVFAGGVVGLAVTWVLISLIRIIPFEHEAFQYIAKPLPVMSLTTTVVVTLILGLVAFAAGIFPARRAASINPAEALRNE
ncbi:ABC transporter permease [candidate division KSB1 bacterium]